MTSTLIAVLLCAAQAAPEQFPAENHAWRRFKPGTWISSGIHVERAGNVVESVQKQTLQEKTDHDYAIDITESVKRGPDLPPRLHRTSNGAFTGEETLTIGGKEVPCRISLSKGKRGDGETGRRNTATGCPRASRIP